MTAPYSPTPRSATYSAGTLIAAGAGLLVLILLLGVLSVVVRDANARATEREVVAGKISVVGAAKLRRWSSDRFIVKVPAGWGLVGTGAADLQGTGDENEREVDVHRWHSTLDDPRKAGECDPRLRCLEIKIEERAGSGAKTPQEFAQKTREDIVAQSNSSSKTAQREQLVDIGPVQGPRNRWMWRLTTAQGTEQRLRYIFATCKNSQVDRFWTVALFSPSEGNARSDLAEILGSLDVDGPTPPRPTKSKRRTNKSISYDSDCSSVLDKAS